MSKVWKAGVRRGSTGMLIWILNVEPLERFFACSSAPGVSGSLSGVLGSRLETLGSPASEGGKGRGAGTVCESASCRESEKAVFVPTKGMYHLICSPLSSIVINLLKV